MSTTASQLRGNIYQVLDRVLETGVPLEISRAGHQLRIVPVDQPSRLARLVPRPEAIVEIPDDLVGIDWSDEWRP